MIISLVLCLAVCSCGKSEQVVEADNLILAIGTVTVESDAQIRKAEKAVEALSADDLEQLENLKVLEDAKVQLQILRDTVQAKEIDNAIEKIGEVTLDSASSITRARSLYKSSSEAVKELVTNFTTLEQAETALSNLRVQDAINTINSIGEVTLDSQNVIEKAATAYKILTDEERKLVENHNLLDEANQILSNLKVENAINAIKNIGRVTLDSKERINNAKNAYNKLTSDEKAKVENADLLEEASVKLADLKREEVENQKKQALSKMKSKTDKVQGITWYEPNAMPHYIDERCYFLPYIGVWESSAFLRGRLNYTGDNWIFWENVIFHIDGVNKSKSFGYGEITRDNDTEVWEYVDFKLTSSDIELLKAIADSEETIIRFQGDKYRHDFTVRSSDKSAIKDVLAAYEAIK